jgi:outer membrane biosynthesis protein TonB
MQVSMPEPKEQINYVAALPVRHVAPKASPSVLRFLVSSVTIRVRVYVNAQGKVVRAESLSRGNALVDYLSNISVNAAREWMFLPAHRGNQDVESETVLQFDFDGSGTTKNSS